MHVVPLVFVDKNHKRDFSRQLSNLMAHVVHVPFSHGIAAALCPSTKSRMFTKRSKTQVSDSFEVLVFLPGSFLLCTLANSLGSFVKVGLPCTS